MAEKKKEKKEKKNTKANATKDAFAEMHSSHPFVAHTQEGDPSHEGEDFEQAIRTSVAATSRGNPDEDQMIERAIRASVMELRLASKDGDNNEAVQRAIQASVAEASLARSEGVSQPRPIVMDGASDHEKELAAALQRSVQEQKLSEERHPLADVHLDDSGVDTDDDENIKAAIERSKSSPTKQVGDSRDKDDYQIAVDLSKKAHEEYVHSLKKSKTEEEIVLEYVKKQSLAEEQFKTSVGDR